MEVRNQDPILHNPISNLEKRIFECGLSTEWPPFDYQNVEAPGHYSIKCDKHTFMEGHLVVFNHPFFFRSRTPRETFIWLQVPPGTYQLRYGMKLLVI